MKLKKTSSFAFCELLHERAGASIYVAIFFVAALIVVTIGTYSATQNAYRATANRMRSAIAQTASEGVLEIARLQAALHEAGWNGAGDETFFQDFYREGGTHCKTRTSSSGGTGSTQNCQPVTSTTDSTITPIRERNFSIDAGWKVRSRPEVKFDFGTGQQLYTIPMALFTDGGDINGGRAGVADAGDRIISTGDAANKCTTPSDIDDPCHWNKLTLGNPRFIPLYYEHEGHPGAICNPVGNSSITTQPSCAPLDTLLVRVRAPCQRNGVAIPGSCTPNERFELYPAEGVSSDYDASERVPFVDETLVTWAIAGSDTRNPDATAPFLFPRSQKKKDATLLGIVRRQLDRAYNSEIYASRINNAGDNALEDTVAGQQMLKDRFVVLDQTQEYGEDIFRFKGPIESFLKNNIEVAEYEIGSLLQGAVNWDDRAIKTPTLRLELVELPRWANNTDRTVNYLEFQILVNRPIGDEKHILLGKTTVDGRMQTDFRYWFRTWEKEFGESTVQTN